MGRVATAPAGAAAVEQGPSGAWPVVVEGPASEKSQGQPALFSVVAEEVEGWRAKKGQAFEFPLLVPLASPRTPPHPPQDLARTKAEELALTLPVRPEY